jgi:hypothetical protein
MFAALLGEVAAKVDGGLVAATGLSEQNPLVKYLHSGQANLGAYFALDDAVVWASIAEMVNAKDALISQLAKGLYDRKLYKCFDVGVRAREAPTSTLSRFRMKLTEPGALPGLELGKTLLTDTAKITAYGIRSLEEPGALQCVLIGRGDNPNAIDDVARHSTIVQSIKEEQVYRIYVPNSENAGQVDQFWRGMA